MPKRNLTTSKIIATARELLLEKGEAAVTFSTVAQKLGIHSQALYNYFNNRQALLDALIAAELDRLYQQLLQAIVGLSGEKAIYKLCETVRISALSQPTMAQALLTFPVNQEFTLSTVAGRQIFALVNQLLATLFTDRVAVINHSRALHSAITGFLTNELAGWFQNPEQSHDESFRKMIGMLL